MSYKKNQMQQLIPYKRRSENVLEAELIIKKVKRNVKAKLYKFIYAIEIFEFVPVVKKVPRIMCTDGEHIFYNPAQIKKVAKKHGLDYLEYMVVHMTIHGILGHFEMEKQFVNRRLIGGIMDIQVETVLKKMGIERQCDWDVMHSPEVYMFFEDVYIDEKEILNGYSSYYKALKSKRNREELYLNEEYFLIDDHNFWRENILPDISKQTNQKSETNKQDQNRVSASAIEKWNKARDLIMEKDISLTSIEQCVEALEKIQDAKGIGNISGNCVEKFEKAAGNGMSYKELIQRFLEEKEYSNELPDSIDIMLYSYGMELYEDVPIIEPNEVNEIKQLGSLVIAIDTSGSCGGNVAERFIRETYNLLNDIHNTAKFESIYLMQCDMELQKEKCLTSVNELQEEEIDTLYGFGGTSFIPVFERIEELQKKEMLKIDALIYLTDSMGVFPEKEPDYPVFLVIPKEMLDSDGKPYNNEIPQWAEWVSMD